MVKSILPKTVRQMCARLSFGVLTGNIVLSSLVAALPVFTPVTFAASVTLSATAVGNYDAWAPNTGTKVTAVAANDGDTSYISASSNGVRQTYVVSNAGIAAGATINSVTVNVVAKTASSNPKIDIFVEKGTGGGQQSAGSDITTTGTYTTYSRVMTTNPFTSAAWTLAEVNAWTTRFGIEKNNAAGNARVTMLEVVVDYTPAPTPGTIIIDKVTNPSGDTQQFTFNPSWKASFNLADGSTADSSSLTPATYSITESAQSGWTQTSFTCSDGSPISAIVLSAGETVTCTATNTKKGHIIVDKVTVPSGDPTVFDFSGEGSGYTGFTLTDEGAANDQEVIPGSYDLWENAETGWTQTSATCSDGSTLPSVSVSAGETVTCTFTNTKKGTLTVHKTTLGGDGTFDFSGDGGIGAFQITTTSGAGDSAALSVVPGTYNITEGTLPADWQLNDNGCTNVVVGAGQSVSCTIENQKQSHIVIQKTTVGGTGTFHFTGIGISGVDITTISTGTPVSNTTDTYTGISGTSYTIDESAITGWNVTSTSCTDGTTDGTSNTFTLDPGETVTCSYTNTASICGNSAIESGEQCDDSNSTGSDGCSETCQVESGYSCAGAPSTCSPTCGDTIVVGSEQCDDGNTENADGCTNVCTLPVCGDSITNGTDQCDDGNVVNTDSCTNACTLPVCGDEIIQSGEQCDDGNTSPGDGCDLTCQIEYVDICHKPGESNEQTLSVSFFDTAGHLGHGDYLGACGSSSSSSSGGSSSSSSENNFDGLILTKTAAAESAVTGDDVTYTVTVLNNGGSNANDLQVTDVVPAGMTFVSATDGGGTDNSDADCEESAGTITCTLSGDGKLQKDNTVIVEVVLHVTADSCGDITNTASVDTSSEMDIDDSGASAIVSLANEGCASSSSSDSSSSSSIASCAEDMLAHWTMEEGTGVFTDDVVGSHDATLENGLGFAGGSPAVAGSTFGLSYDGSDDEGVVGEGSSDFAFNNSDFSVSLWTKVASAADANRSVLGHFDNQGDGFRGWGLYYYNTGNVNFFGYGAAGSNDASVASSVLDGGWHNVVGVYKRSGANLTIETYVDGVLVASNTASIGGMMVNTPMRLGHYNFQPNFKGDMDDVRVYARSLSADEVALLSTGCGTGGGSSSSSNSSEGSESSSSSSEGGGDEQVSIQDVTADTDDGTGNGGHHGNRYDSRGAAMKYVMSNTPAGAFGGGPDPRICAGQRLIGDNPPPAMVEYIAGLLAPELDITRDQIVDLLTDPTYCRPINTSLVRPVKTVAAAVKPVPFYVDADGIPVSRGNPVFDLCIAGKPIPLSLIRNNPDQIDLDHRGKIKTGASCDEYYLGDGLWKHPDHPGMAPFTFALKPKKVLTLPAPYVLTTQTYNVGKK